MSDFSSHASGTRVPSSAEGAWCGQRRPTSSASSLVFAHDPPDLSGLSGAERLNLLRGYRRSLEEKEREAEAARRDFARGPPSLEGLDGAEQLSILREYRQWLEGEKWEKRVKGQEEKKEEEADKREGGEMKREERNGERWGWVEGEDGACSASGAGLSRLLPAGTVLPRAAPAMQRPCPAVPCWMPDKEAARPGEPASEAGDVAGSSNNLRCRQGPGPLGDAFSPAAGNAPRIGYYDRFERPRTARPNPTAPPWLDDARLPRPTGRARPALGTNAQEDHLGSALGGLTTADPAAELAWVATRRSSDRPDVHSNARVFMVDEAIDHESCERNAAARKALLEQRLAAQDAALAARLGTAGSYVVAGAATPRDGFNVNAIIRSEPANLQPPTVGMNARQADDARRAWRETLVAGAGGPTPISPERQREAAEASTAYAAVDARVANSQPVAGMSSTYRHPASQRAPGIARPGIANAAETDATAAYNLSVMTARGTAPATPPSTQPPPWCGGAIENAPLSATRRGMGAAAPLAWRDSVGALLGGGISTIVPMAGTSRAHSPVGSPIVGHQEITYDNALSKREWRQQLNMSPRTDGLAG